MISEPPNLHELEVSVFGPGVGECIVAHVGDGDWIVVDSCINRESQEPVALEYLKSLHVDIPSRVRLVVATREPILRYISYDCPEVTASREFAHEVLDGGEPREDAIV